MTPHGEVNRLEGLMDGDLPAGERDALMRHIEACTECQDEHRRLVALKAASAALPRGITPPEDMWPAIQSGIAVPASRRWSWQPAVAAAALLMVVTSAVTLYVARQRRPSESTVVTASGVGSVLPARYGGFESRYQVAVTELEEVLIVGRSRLAPETVAIVERNLALIDAAIVEARDALSADPASRGLWDLLNQRYQDKLMVLQGVSRLVTRS